MVATKRRNFDRSAIFQFYYAIHTMITLISPGMNFGWSSVAIPLLLKNETDGEALLARDEWAVAWFASMVGLAGPCGCLLGTFCMRLGRKIPMAIVGFGCAAGWLIIATSYSVEQLLIGRFIGGIATGLVSAPTVVYIVEITEPRYRLLLTNGTSLSIVVGIMLSYVIGFFIRSWRLQAAIAVLIPFSSAISILFFLPESPVWLLHKNRCSKARASLLKIRGLRQETPEFTVEFEEMLVNCQNQRQIELSELPTAEIKITEKTQPLQNLWSIIKLPIVWKPFLILNFLFFFQQFCGIYVIVAYSVDMVNNCGFSGDSFLITAVIGVIQLLGSVCLIGTSHRLGVRKITLISTISMSLSLGLLAIYLQFIAPTDPGKSYQSIAIISLLVFVASGAFGLMAVPWSLVGELYPTKYVHYLGPFTTCLANIFNFVSLLIYPSLKAYSFVSALYTYCAVSVAATIFIALVLPETKGIPHHEIIKIFQK